MASLTPKHLNEETVGMAMSDGIVNGTLVLFPAMGVLYGAMQRPGFVKVTNWQSRTAMVIMPAMFAFVFTAEEKMVHRMREVAEETDHALKSVEWAEHQHHVVKQTDTDKEKLRDLYRTSVLASGVQVVDAEELGAHHKLGNYVQANPFKVIAGVGIPAVASIFYGQTGKEHVNMQMKILHTRVFGQFAVICTLMGVMGLKEMMDRSGRYITESDVESRVAEMEKTRTNLLARLDYQMSQNPHPIHPKKEKHHKKEKHSDHKKEKHTDESKTSSRLITE